MLNNLNEPVTEFTYFDCIDTIVEKSKLLGETGELISTHVKSADYDQLGKVVDSTCEAVCQLTEATAQVCHCYSLPASPFASFLPHIGSLLGWHSQPHQL